MIVSERSEPVVISASTMISMGKMGFTPEMDIAENITGRKTPEEPVMISFVSISMPERELQKSGHE